MDTQPDLTSLNDDEIIYRRFIELLDDKYIEYVYADLIADAMKISQRNLNRAVKNISGKTACRLAEEKIVAESKKILANTNHTIKNIAWELGFEDHFYFSRMFKKVTGLPPGKFRKTLAHTK
jgi:AraC family transcriptional regulator, transcriptional activator of pobA